MNRTQLEHVLRASAGITGATEFVVIGSQAILGQVPNAPAELLVSMEADLFVPGRPEDSTLIDGSIGEGSPFHQTFGYYAHGVGSDTAVLPNEWERRLVPLTGPGTAGAIGRCLEVHDLAISKLVAGRAKDLAYVEALIRGGLAHPTTLADRLLHTRVPDQVRVQCAGRLGLVTRRALGESE